MSTRSRKLSRILGIVAAASLMATASASAATITFYTGDGGDSLLASVTPGVVTPLVALHDAWDDVSGFAGLSLDTAQWISYRNTGVGGFVAPDAASRNKPDATAVFTRSFTIGGPGDFTFWGLADDTATVVLSGPGSYSNEFFTAYALQHDPCAGGGQIHPIGCKEADIGVYSTSGLGAGLYTLTVYAFQTNKDVFGIQYAGNYSTAGGVEEQDLDPVPEPASLVLLGSGLVGLAHRVRRGRKMRA